MPDVDPTRVELFWRRAPDRDVAEALACRNDYPPEVFAVIEDAGRKRNLEARPPEAVPHPLAPIARGFARALDGIHAHRNLSAGIFGFAVRAGASVIGPLVVQGGGIVLWLASFLVVYLGGLGAICWPLNRYHVVAKASLCAALGVAMATLLQLPTRARQMGWSLGYVFAAMLGTLAVSWLMSTLLLWAAVYFRRKHWPVYPPGHCKGCGYDLRGLPVPRCPECGRAFDPAELTPSPAQTA